MWNKLHIFFKAGALSLPLFFFGGCALLNQLVFSLHKNRITPLTKQEYKALHSLTDSLLLFCYIPEDSSYLSRKRWLQMMDKLNTDPRKTMFELHVNYYDSLGNLLRAEVSPYCPRIAPDMYFHSHRLFINRDTNFVTIDTSNNLYSYKGWYDIKTGRPLRLFLEGYHTYIVMTFNKMNFREFFKAYYEYMTLNDPKVKLIFFNTDMPSKFGVYKNGRIKLKQTLGRLARTAIREGIDYRYYFKFF